jgi:ATP-binding cassette, subfamily G (WHITE), member 2, PDR
MAQEFFTSRGWHCPLRQTTADFLTSLTNPSERIPKEGWHSRVPRTADEFAKQWQESPERKQLLAEIEQYESEYPIGGELLEKFKHSRNAQQANRMCVTICLFHFPLRLLTPSHDRNVKSPYTISFPMQVRLCTWRGMRRLAGDMATFYSTIIGNFAMALIIGTPSDEFWTECET